MKMRVYVETSIFSFLTSKPSRNILSAAWQSLTIEWWETRRDDFDLFISELVREEGQRGDPDAAAKRIAAMKDIPFLHMTEAAALLAKKLVFPGPLAPKAADDALHLALSAIHKMDFLLTWNCRHIDNAEIKPKVRKIINTQGYDMPEICTPQELRGEENYEE
jgi:hypothetical protein